MTRYEKYKPSGIEWIGEIPEHWEVKRLKRFAKICNGQDHKSVYDLDGKYPIMGSGGEFGRANTFLHPGPSVLLGRKGTVDKPRYVDFPFWSVDTAYFTDIFSITNPRFFYYLCTTIKFDLYKYGSAVPSMNQEVLGQIEFTSPPLIEQFSIATYLDRKTAEIDQIIANKQKLITLYEEEKQAVINHTVTRGVNPDVRLKPSGVEWLGDIPEHWNLIKLKRISNKITDGEHISPTFTLEGMPFLSAKDVRDEYVQFDYDKFVNFEEGIKFRKRCNPEKGDVLIVSRGATVGRVAIVETDEQFCLLGSVILVKPSSKILNKYLLYSLKNKLLQDNFLLTSQSSAQQAIYLVNVSEIHLSMPLIDEQRFIIAFIEKESNRLDTIIEKCKKQIELLKEYRTTLISEVVTGKVKVSN
jgi:type I restriction enzyme S subunit